MTCDELASKLRNAYQKAPRGERMIGLILFGLRHKDEIESMRDCTYKELFRKAGVSPSNVEVRYGRQLTQYITLDEEDGLWF